MPSSLQEAIKMDLRLYPLKKQAELRSYTKYLLEEAYNRKDGDTNAHKYARQKTKPEIENEIRSMVYKGDLMLNYDALFDAVTDEILANYTEISSFDDVMEKTLTYYSNKYDLTSYEKIKKMVNMILNNYFNRGNINVFSSTNGTRDYVRGKHPNQIRTEIINGLGKNDYSINEFEAYADKVASDWFNKNISTNETVLNDEETLKQKIIKEIDHLNVNDNLKKYLKAELESGIIDSLNEFVSKDLIDEYKKNVLNANDYGNHI